MKKHSDILQELYDLYAAKNHDYGDSFHQTYRKYGIASLMIRLHDKLSRLETLSKSEAKVKDESFRNTLIDLVNYGILGLMEIDEEPMYPEQVEAAIQKLERVGCEIISVNTCFNMSYPMYVIHYIWTDKNSVRHRLEYYVPNS